MSSLAATQADGYYLPPEYYESGAYLKLTKNRWHATTTAVAASASGQRRHRSNAKPPPPVVRFELPCSGICTNCNHFIGKGTRFNAVKAKTGDKYLNSSIWEFRMKCRSCCEQEFVIRTNPQAKCFDFLQGIKRAQGGGGGGGVGEGGGSKRDSNKNKNDNDSDEQAKEVLDRLEIMARGQRKAFSEMDQLRSLQKASERCYSLDSDRNAAIRATFRVERKVPKRQRKAADALGYREGISLMDPTVEDTLHARLTTFGDCRERERQKLREARSSSIFSEIRKAQSRRKPKLAHALTCQRPAKPYGITSSSDVAQPTVSALSVSHQHTSSKRPVHSERSPIRKKTLVVAQNASYLSVATSSAIQNVSDKQQYVSALQAVADYGSDCS